MDYLKRNMKKGVVKKTKLRKETSVRTHRKALLFNDAEWEAVNSFCKKYKISNQSRFFREAIISSILRKTEEDHPTLF
jgi:Mor family transcriptional regulator